MGKGRHGVLRIGPQCLHRVRLVPRVCPRGPGRAQDSAVPDKELAGVLETAHDKVGVPRVGGRRCLEGKLPVRVQPGHDLRAGEVDAGDEILHRVRGVVVHRDIPLASREGYRARKAKEVLGPERVGPRETEEPRGVEDPVSRPVVIAGNVEDERPLHEEVVPRLPVEAEALAVDLVHEVHEVHRHEIEALDLRARVTVAELEQGGQLAAPQADRTPRVVPHELRVAFIGLVRVQRNGVVMGPLHDVHAPGSDDKLSRRIVVGHRDVHEVRQPSHQKIPAVLEIVWVVSECLDLLDLLVEAGYLSCQLVDLLDRAAHVVVQHVADALEPPVPVMNPVDERLASLQHGAPGRHVGGVDGELLPR